MVADWETVPLASLYDFGSGLSKPREEFGFGYGFLSFKDVFHNYFVPTTLSQLVNSTGKEQQSCSIVRGDVFLTRTSETMDELGMSCAALKNYEGATFNGFTKRLRPKSTGKIIPEYAGYYFRSPKFRRDVTAMSSLSTRASLNNEMLARLTIDLPPVEVQAAIGSVLKALDDKIELNRRMNATLEAMARALFQSWFVDFDPVRAKLDGRQPAGLDEATAAIFPEHLEETALGHTPKGWEVRSLDKTAHYLNGLALQKYPPGDGLTLPVIKIAQLRKGDSVGADRCNTDLPQAYIVQDGDVLFSWSGSLEVELWCGGPGALNQHLFKVTSSEFPKWFYYLWTLYHLDEFRLIAADKATTMGHIQRGHLTAAKVLIPPRPLLNAMTRTMAPLIDQLVANRTQSHTLATLRDTLLPKLLNGELSVAAVANQ
jgi:type I restriction enzyme S subunit